MTQISRDGDLSGNEMDEGELEALNEMMLGDIEAEEELNFQEAQLGAHHGSHEEDEGFVEYLEREIDSRLLRDEMPELDPLDLAALDDEWSEEFNDARGG